MSDENSSTARPCGERWDAVAHALQPFIFDAGAALGELDGTEAAGALAALEALAQACQRHDEGALRRMAAAARPSPPAGPGPAPPPPSQATERRRRGRVRRAVRQARW